MGVAGEYATRLAKCPGRSVRRSARDIGACRGRATRSVESVFRAQGMKNPTPRMQMIDGFNAGWIDFSDRGAHARKGSIDINQAIATLIDGAKLQEPQ